MRLTRLTLVAFVCTLTGGMCHAAPKMILKLEHSSVLKYESVHAFLSIYNDSDYPLKISGESVGAAKLGFQIERKRDEWLPRTGRGPLIEKLSLAPGEQRNIAINLSDHYNLGSGGRYLVRGFLEVNDNLHISDKVMLDVVDGIEIGRAVRDIGGREKVKRSYSLRYWKRADHELLFLTVDDKPTLVNQGVFQLGRLLRVDKPKIKVDRDGNVDVLHRRSPDCFIRTKFKSSRYGVRFVDQKYELPSGEPYPNLRPKNSKPFPRR